MTWLDINMDILCVKRLVDHKNIGRRCQCGTDYSTISLSNIVSFDFFSNVSLTVHRKQGIPIYSNQCNYIHTNVIELCKGRAGYHRQTLAHASTLARNNGFGYFQ
jgi:hypothetical protein